LPDETQESRAARFLPLRFIAIQLADQAEPGRDRELTNQAPDSDHITVRPLDAQAAVEMEHEWTELAARDADTLESYVAFSLYGRWQ
jgi:hypothetical protein